MKKFTIATIAFTTMAFSSALAGSNLQTRAVMGFNGDGDAIYGSVNGLIQTKSVLGFTKNADLDPIYGPSVKSVGTKTVVGFDGDGDAIYN